MVIQCLTTTWNAWIVILLTVTLFNHRLAVDVQSTSDDNLACVRITMCICIHSYACEFVFVYIVIVVTCCLRVYVCIHSYCGNVLPASVCLCT